MLRSNPRRSVFGTRAGALTVLSFLFWTLFVLVKPQAHPYADLSRGKFTDHFSHMNTVRLFPRVGLDLYRVPIKDHGHPLRLDEIRALPKDIPAKPGNCEVWGVDGWPKDKPLVASWTHRPRMHPPGDLVLLAPAAIAYHFTSLSFSNANRLLIVLFLLYAHVSLYFVFEGALVPKQGFTIGLFATAFLYSEVIHWTLEGFYEASVIGPLVLCARSVARRRWLPAILAFAVAAFIHFRSLFFLPLPAIAAAGIVADREWTRWGRREGAMLAGIVFFGGAAAGIYAILWPTLKDLPLENAVLSFRHPDPASFAAFGIVLVLTAIVFLWTRSWLDLVLLAWMTLLLVQLREAYEWNLLSMLAWLGVPVITRSESARWVQDARIFFLMFVAAVALRDAVVPVWLLQAVAR